MHDVWMAVCALERCWDVPNADVFGLRDARMSALPVVLRSQMLGWDRWMARGWLASDDLVAHVDQSDSMASHESMGMYGRMW